MLTNDVSLGFGHGGNGFTNMVSSSMTNDFSGGRGGLRKKGSLPDKKQKGKNARKKRNIVKKNKRIKKGANVPVVVRKTTASTKGEVKKNRGPAVNKKASKMKRKESRALKANQQKRKKSAATKGKCGVAMLPEEKAYQNLIRKWPSLFDSDAEVTRDELHFSQSIDMPMVHIEDEYNLSPERTARKIRMTPEERAYQNAIHNMRSLRGSNAPTGNDA